VRLLLLLNRQMLLRLLLRLQSWLAQGQKLALHLLLVLLLLLLELLLLVLLLLLLLRCQLLALLWSLWLSPLLM